MPDPDAAVPGGAGTLILVVGPSGAGKDALIDRARTALAGHPVLFPRRIVTRPSSAAEAHDSLHPDAFSKASAEAAFAFEWQAHGLRYAIPAAIDRALAQGRTVVCNVSRGIVPDLRARYGKVHVIYVDAPLAVRLARIAGRARRTDAPDRARRQQGFMPKDADVVVDNAGALDPAAAAFVTAIAQAMTATTRL